MQFNNIVLYRINEVRFQENKSGVLKNLIKNSTWEFSIHITLTLPKTKRRKDVHNESGVPFELGIHVSHLEISGAEDGEQKISSSPHQGVLLTSLLHCHWY